MRYTANVPRMIHETLLDETILIDTLTGTYFSMRGAAIGIWQSLLIGVSLDETLSALSALPSAPPTLAEEVSAFWGRLIAEGLIVPTERGVAAAITAVSYETPVLETFTDVQALLVVDPLHEVGDRGWPQRP